MALRCSRNGEPLASPDEDSLSAPVKTVPGKPCWDSGSQSIMSLASREAVQRCRRRLASAARLSLRDPRRCGPASRLGCVYRWVPVLRPHDINSPRTRHTCTRENRQLLEGQGVVHFYKVTWGTQPRLNTSRKWHCCNTNKCSGRRRALYSWHPGTRAVLPVRSDIQVAGRSSEAVA